MYSKILSALESQFVNCDEIARVLALAIQSGKNVLLWGPGGHGKSEMVGQALSAVAVESEIFVQSFGEGMDEATLWGGLDFAALENEKQLRYFPEQSFLAKSYAVFEEIFDAPASVLLALKDTLTAKNLRKGSQTFAMATKVVVAITNKDPGEISELGPAAHALIERFPLQLKVEWSSYGSADYLKLFRKVGPHLGGAGLNGTEGVLAELFAKASAGGEVVSPRTAIHGLGVVKAAAALRSGGLVEKEDLADLRFVPGLEVLAENIRQELDAAFERAAAEGLLAAAERKLQGLLVEIGEAGTSPIKLLQVARRLTTLGDETAALKITDGLSGRRKALREAVDAKVVAAQAAAFANTRA